MTDSSTILSGSHSLGKAPLVTLAAGSTTNVDGLGSITLNSSHSLDSILHVPRFPYSLMSVSKLTKSLNYSVTFFPGSCVFQDLLTGKKIDGVAEHGGLYYFSDGEHPSLVALQSLS